MIVQEKCEMEIDEEMALKGMVRYSIIWLQQYQPGCRERTLDESKVLSMNLTYQCSLTTIRI